MVRMIFISINPGNAVGSRVFKPAGVFEWLVDNSIHRNEIDGCINMLFNRLSKIILALMSRKLA